MSSVRLVCALKIETMNKFKVVLFYLLVFFLFGCKAKKQSTYVEKVKDSTVRNIILESKNTLQISTLCDSIGKPKEFTQTIDNGNGKTTVTVKDNQLFVQSKTDSIVYVDKEVIKEVTSVETIIVYKTPSWAWWYIIIITLAALVGWKVWRLF